MINYLNFHIPPINDEDVHLCNVYLHIFQNPIVGINQSKDRLIGYGLGLRMRH